MLNGSTVFTQIISAPLVQLPVMLASAIDAFVALRRIGTFMRAEELAVPYEIDPHADAAVDVDGDFTWETVRKDATNENGPSSGGGEERKEKEEKPFELIDVKLKIPRGSFVAIVGRVGSGKVRRSCIVLCLHRG